MAAPGVGAEAAKLPKVWDLFGGMHHARSH